MSDAEHKLNRLPIDHPSSYGGMMQENAALHAEVARLLLNSPRSTPASPGKRRCWGSAERLSLSPVLGGRIQHRTARFRATRMMT